MSSDSREPNKTKGQFHSMKGSAVEAIGNATGAQSWINSGKEEHASGEAEYNAARAQGYAEGSVDRVGGKKDSVMGAIKGDKSQETQGNWRHDKGQAQQDINKNA